MYTMRKLAGSVLDMPVQTPENFSSAALGLIKFFWEFPFFFLNIFDVFVEAFL